MIGKNKLGACLPAFSSCADRFCLSGYGKGGKTIEEMLDMASRVKEIDGLELIGNWHINDKNIELLKRIFKERNLEVCMITPDLWTQAKWGSGSIASPDARTRKEAIQEIKKSMDWAANVNCKYIDVWPGQDGFDYPLQADYINSWKWLKDAITECCEYRKDVKVLVEYKIKEPRTHCFINTAAKTILLLQGLKNTGCIIDFGHSLVSGENVAEALCLISSYRLFEYLHLNDNYSLWDDDMIFSSVHIPESMEIIYWLKKINYTGWLTLDIFPYREEKIPAAKNCIDWLKTFFEIIDKTAIEEIDNVLKKGDANESVALVRKLLTGK